MITVQCEVDSTTRRWEADRSGPLSDDVRKFSGGDERVHPIETSIAVSYTTYHCVR